MSALSSRNKLVTLEANCDMKEDVTDLKFLTSTFTLAKRTAATSSTVFAGMAARL